MPGLVCVHLSYTRLSSLGYRPLSVLQVFAGKPETLSHIILRCSEGTILPMRGSRASCICKRKLHCQGLLSRPTCASGFSVVRPFKACFYSHKNHKLKRSYPLTTSTALEENALQRPLCIPSVTPRTSSAQLVNCSNGLQLLGICLVLVCLIPTN